MKLMMGHGDAKAMPALHMTQQGVACSYLALILMARTGITSFMNLFLMNENGYTMMWSQASIAGKLTGMVIRLPAQRH